MTTKTTAVSLGVVLLVAAGVAGGYSSCGGGSSKPVDGGLDAKGGTGGGGGAAGAGGTAGAGGAHDGGAGTGGTGNCGGNFAPNDAGPLTGTTAIAAVQVIIDSHCVSCHTEPDGGATSLPGSLDLTDIASVVSVEVSEQCGPVDGGEDAGADASVAVRGKMIIEPNHPELSYLVDKVIGHAQNCGCFSGARQPPMCDQPDASDTCLSTTEIQVIVNWIAAGAQ